jgi:hypothetical protein
VEQANEYSSWSGRYVRQLVVLHRKRHDSLIVGDLAIAVELGYCQYEYKLYVTDAELRIGWIVESWRHHKHSLDSILEKT